MGCTGADVPRAHKGGIAEVLSYSTGTIKPFLHHVSGKLGARNRSQAVLLALRKSTIKSIDIYSLEKLVHLLSSIIPETGDKRAQTLREA